MMRLAIALALILASGAAFSADPGKSLIRQGRLSVATTATTLPVGPEDPAWARASAVTLTAYPQNTVAPGLTEANTAPLAVELRAIAGSGEIALRLSWKDETESTWQKNRTDAFADAAAIQFGAPDKDGVLPYIGMGEPKRPVTVWFWRNGKGEELLEAYGFGTMKPRPGKKPEVEAAWEAGTWRAVFRGSIPARAGPLTLAIALWDGDKQGRDGRKRLTTWYLLRVPGLAEDSKVLAILAEQARINGNAERGKVLTEERGCNACHRLPGGEPVAIGPDLTLAGGIHWPGYLRRSISNPSDFILPLDRYAEEGNLKTGTSLMPVLDFSAKDVEDLAAYLASLK